MRLWHFIAIALLAAPAAARQAAPPPATGSAVPAELAAGANVERVAQQQQQPARGGPVSLAQATKMATDRYRGRAVRAETKQVEGRAVHEILVMTENNSVRTVRIDPQTGAFQ